MQNATNEPRLIKLPLDESKPGRQLLPLDLEDLSAQLGRPIEHLYFVFFDEQGRTAGNHWHRKKWELFFCVRGEVRVSTVNKDTGRTEQRTLISYLRHKQKALTGLLIPADTPHAVHSLTPDAILAVLTNKPARVPEDDHEYEVPQL